MPQAAYKINDRRGKNQPSYYRGPANNSLYKAATQTDERKSIPNLDWDHERNISRLGHRQLRNVGKFLYANFPIISGALDEQAWLSVSTFIPQFTGKDKNWGELAEARLKEWGKIMNVRGWDFDECDYRVGVVTTTKREGAHFTLQVDNGDGYPLIQAIPPHRVGSRLDEHQVVGGPYDGYYICNGIIQDDYGRAVAYRVYSDGYLTGDYVDIPANVMFQSFFPKYVDQGIGLSALASSACDWQDVQERREFELLAQKLGSSIALIEKNEAGEALNPSDHVVTPEETTDTAATPTGLVIEKFDKGTVRYIKGGDSIEALRYDRPSRDSQDFEAAIIRGAFKGMEWDVDFSLDPSKVGGAQMRIVVEKINRAIERNQALVEKAMRRIHGWAISKFIKLGLLPPNDEWFKWEYQGPGEITADKKHDSDVDIQEIAQNIQTRKRACAKRGLFRQDVDRERFDEADSDLTRAGELAKKHKVPIELAITMLRPPTPNGVTAQPKKEEQEPPKNPLNDE